MSLPEVLLWTRLRPRAPDRPAFRRQHAVGPYILDFYCASLRLAIEIDGETHRTAQAAAHDASRTQWLGEQGIEVLRIAASEVLTDPDAAADWLLNLVRIRSL